MNKAAGRPRAADIEARHQNLIHTAGQLFLKLGYDKVSLELIAREAHVAVRTIYVKFGGKSGLFQAVLEDNRDKFMACVHMDDDARPLKEIIGEFAEHFYEMITAPDALEIQRMVVAEAKSNPELAQTFFAAGPRQSRETLTVLFARPEIRAQLRHDVPLDLLPGHLLNCIIGDFFSRFIFGPPTDSYDEVMRKLHQRLDLFYHSVLRAP
jgi:TetR/AcrR family transcriptional repressor of mexJK operon